LERLRDPEYRSCALIVDATKPDHPITFATAEFMRVTGYHRDFIIGRNCRFLQGPDTCAQTTAEIRRAVGNARPIRTELLNYRKDGRKLLNKMLVRPHFDAAGKLTVFSGYQSFTLIDCSLCFRARACRA